MRFETIDMMRYLQSVPSRVSFSPVAAARSAGNGRNVLAALHRWYQPKSMKVSEMESAKLKRAQRGYAATDPPELFTVVVAPTQLHRQRSDGRRLKPVVTTQSK